MEAFMEELLLVVKQINSFMWDNALLFLLCGTGIFFTFRLKFVQVTKFWQGMKSTFGGMKLFGKKADQKGMSSFQSLATAVAAQVGTGNLAGAATAIVSGGPGAIFWMWVSAFFGMATIFAEATLAQEYKTEKDGKVTGGPVYYIRAAFKGKVGKILAALFAVFIVLALGFMGNMVQSNSIGMAFQNAFGIPPIWVGVILGAIALFVFRGGLARIVSVTEKIVPIMAGFYLIGAIILLGINYLNILPAFQSIFVGAFQPQAVMGGLLGAGVREAIRYGVARGLFSNEAGMGSTPHAHALANVKHPCDQGVVAVIGLFIDTFVILTITALVMISSGVLTNPEIVSGTVAGIGVAQMSFASAFGTVGNIFVAICLLFFAFSTILGWYFFGEANIKYLFGEKAVKFYSILVVAFIVLGSSLKVELVWQLADCFNGLMVIPNLFALLALSPVVAKLYKDYGKTKKESPLQE